MVLELPESACIPIVSDDARKSEAEILWATTMTVNIEKKESTVKGDRCDLAKDPPTVKSIFSLGHKDGK